MAVTMASDCTTAAGPVHIAVNMHALYNTHKIAFSIYLSSVHVCVTCHYHKDISVGLETAIELLNDCRVVCALVPVQGISTSVQQLIHTILQLLHSSIEYLKFYTNTHCLSELCLRRIGADFECIPKPSPVHSPVSLLASHLREHGTLETELGLGREGKGGEERGGEGREGEGKDMQHIN